MSFRVISLKSRLFKKFYGKSDSDLKKLGALPYIADIKPGYPCRVSLRDAEPGERLVLLNFEHQGAENPYRASHAIFVIDGADEAAPAINEVPEMLACRLLSIRAFDAKDMMVDSDVIDGHEAAECFETMLLKPGVEYLHVHNADRKSTRLNSSH